VVGIAEGVVHHIHLGLELESHREVVDILVAVGHMGVAEEGGIDLVGRMVVVVEARIVQVEVQEEHHIDLVVEEEGIDPEGRHTEAADSLAVRRGVVEEGHRMAAVEAAHRTAVVVEELRTAVAVEELRIAEEEHHIVAVHMVVEGNELGAGHHIGLEGHRKEVDMPLSRVLCESVKLRV